MTIRSAVLLLLLAASAEARESSPRLVLLLTMDQARGDYLERFRPALTGGLRTLLEEGAVFADAHHFHATTVTAAGHASLSTGRFPSRSGIVGNQWYDRNEGRGVYCVEDGDAPILAPKPTADAWRPPRGRSPERLLGTGLGDWLREREPKALVFSVGGKDRSAVLMGGKRPNGAYWYDATSGHWVTSRYYAAEYPAWVERFQERRAAEAYFGATWEPLPVEDELLEAMEIAASGEGADDEPIPRALGGARLAPDRVFYQGLFESPFIESYLLDFARELVVEEDLGRDDAVDVLALAFSSIDSVGHAYGPNSRELLDAVIRLDRELERFFRFIDERVGWRRVAVLLSADHGVAPLPEYQRSRGLPGARLTAEHAACVQDAGNRFERRFGEDRWFVAPLYFDGETLERRGLARETVESFLADALARCPGVARVWSRTVIERAAATNGWTSPELELYVHGFHPNRSPDLYVQLEKYVLARRRGTTHGSPYAYDTHVTALLLWPGSPPRTVRERVHTVDLPVTLAALLGIDVPEGLDGVDRSPLIR